MGKINRSELLRSLVEDAEGYDGKEEWRESKKQRRLKSLRESKSPKGKDTRRAWKLQRAIRHGEYPFGEDKKTNRNEDIEHDNNEY